MDMIMADIPAIPLAVFGRIGTYLNPGKQEKLVKSQITEGGEYWDEMPGELTNLCVAGGREVADVVRFEYLHKNETFLRRAIATNLKKKVKILTWMEANEDWKDRCCRSTVTAHANHRRLTVYPGVFFGVLKSANGTLVYREFEGKNVIRESDCLLYVNGTDVTGWPPDEVESKIADDKLPYTTLSFLSDVNCIFSDPVTAISLRLTPVLKYMIESQDINANDMFQCEFDPYAMGGSADTITKKPLLFHSMVNSEDTSCFDYLMSLADIDCSVEFNNDGRRTNVLFTSLYSFDFWCPLYALKAILAHPTSPDINGRDGDGCTVLHYICKGCEDYYGRFYYNDDDIDQLSFLLDNGADPSIRSEEGHLPIDIIHTNYWNSDEDNIDEDDKETFNEMVRLLLIPRGKRDVDQPPITNFFKKRRLC